jgi:hypothetical protein
MYRARNPHDGAKHILGHHPVVEFDMPDTAGGISRNSSRQANFPHTINRAIFMPPPVDPAQPPMNIETNRITWLNPGNSS